MRYGMWQTVTAEAKRDVADSIEATAKNQCVRSAWAAGYRAVGKPFSAWELLKPEQTERLGPPHRQGDWQLRVWIDAEPRPQPEENTEEEGFGFA